MTILTGTNIAKTFAEQNDYSKNQYFDRIEILLGIIERVLDSGEDIARSEILMDGCFYRIGLNLKLKTDQSILKRRRRCVIVWQVFTG